MISSYPVCVAFVLIFSVLGMVANSKGLRLVEILVMSGTIFAIPLQALIVENPDMSLWDVALAAVLLNARFVLMSMMLVQLWRRSTLTKIMSLCFISSSIYMVCSTEKKVQEPWSFYMGVCLPSYATALVSTALGYLTWGVCCQHRVFLESLAQIVLPLHFLCLSLKRSKELGIIIATFLGIVCTFILEKNGVPKQMLIFIWVAIAAFMITVESKVCGKL